MSSNPSLDGTDAATPRSWNTLEELRQVAYEEGCTTSEIEEALRACSGDLLKTASYLQIQLLSRRR